MKNQPLGSGIKQIDVSAARTPNMADLWQATQRATTAAELEAAYNPSWARAV